MILWIFEWHNIHNIVMQIALII